MIIAFSGRVDSSLLAVVATETLGDKYRSILLDSQVGASGTQELENIQNDKPVAGQVRAWRSCTKQLAPIHFDVKVFRTPNERCAIQ
jgi:GMP synthase PP-ATPase subunit